MKSKRRIIIYAVLAGLVFWLVDSLADYFFFYKKGFFDLLVFNVPRHEIYIRLTVFAIFVFFGVIISKRISRQKEAQQETAKEKEILEAAIDALTHPFYVIDVDNYTVKLANKAANVDLLSDDRRCHVLTHRSPKPCAGGCVCPLEIIKKTKKPTVVEHKHVDKDGNYKIVEVHAYPVFDSAGKLTEIIEYDLDITERTKIHKEVESLAKFPSQNPSPVLRISENGIILYANEAAGPFCVEWGCGIGSRISTYLVEVIINSVESGLSKNIEVNIDEKTFLFSIVPIVAEKYVNMYGLDITDRKKAEKKLIKAMEIKSHFVSMVSHELRTPLAAIKEGVGIVLDRMSGDINEEQERFLGIAKANVDRLDRLMNEVLDFQKIGAGKLELESKEINMNSLAKEVKNMTEKIANDKGLELKLELDKRLPLVKFDKDRIIQVILNLVNNAIKFTEKGYVRIITSQGDNFIKLAVEDTGPGIKKENLEKLFVEFSQIPITEKTKLDGTGLGLAICREIIRMHNGKIWAESTPGKGSVFSFILAIRERRRV